MLKKGAPALSAYAVQQDCKSADLPRDNGKMEVQQEERDNFQIGKNSSMERGKAICILGY